MSEQKTIGAVGFTSEKEYPKNMTILINLNVLPTFTCTLYTIDIVPKRNNVCLWAGVSGQNVAKSLFLDPSSFTLSAESPHISYVFLFDIQPSLSYIQPNQERVLSER